MSSPEMSSPRGRQIPASLALDETPDAAASERQEVDPTIRHAENSHPSAPRFDYLIAKVSYMIHGYGSLDLSPHEIFILADLVAKEIMLTIKEIPSECQDHPNSETRLEGLSALQQIGDIILWAGPSELGIQVRMHFDCNSVLERAMLKIVDEMSSGEKLAICDEEDRGDEPPLLARILRLKEEGRYCLLYDNMDWVVNALEDTSLPNEDE
ncbi:hypothetical protein PoHVEF18_001577 [Penicillium ochrochloron]